MTSEGIVGRGGGHPHPWLWSGWVLGFLLLSGCSGLFTGPKPIGSRDGRVLSRYRGTPLSVLSQPTDVVLATHVVRPGETLWGISRKYGTTVKELKALNGISDVRSVSVGTRLVVRSKQGVALAEKASGSSGKPRIVRPGSNKSYPLAWPVSGSITSRFGRRNGKAHDGIDIEAKKGTKIFASSGGEVLFSDRHGGYGNLVVLKHKSGLVTVYAHNLRNLVRKGDRVKTGQPIGLVGDTGRATGPHLHFEVRRGALPQNPLRFLPP